MKTLLIFLLIIIIIFIYFYYFFILINSMNPKNLREREQREKVSLSPFFFFFFFFLLLGSFHVGTEDRRSPPFVGPFRPWRRPAAEGSHSSGYGEIWPAVDCDRRRRKIQGKRGQNRSLFSDQKSATPITDSHMQRYGRKGKEGEEDLPRPPVTPPTSNHGKNKMVSAAPIGKNREKERGRGPMFGF